VVALGAAIQGGVLAGEVTDVLLLDVTPLSLGIETMGGVVVKLIERNTTVPTRKSQTFSTAEDNQTAVDIRVFQGEREFAKDNKLLGQFRLEGIPAAPRGMPQIEVTFDIDANGIVNVSAKDKATNKEQKITITSSSGLSKEEIDKMVNEGKAHESEDKKARELIEKKNRLDGLILEIERSIKENKEKIAADDLQAVEQELATAKTVLKEKEQDEQALQEANDKLSQAWYKVAEKLYKQSTAQEQGKTDQKDSEQGPIDTEPN
jgi:molecular chaperone DnaK